MTLADEIYKMIEDVLRASTWTSAGDTRVTNFLNEFRGVGSPDLEGNLGTSGTSSSEGDSGVSGIGGKLGAGDLTTVLGATGGKGSLGLISKFGGAIAPVLPIALALSIQPISEAVIAELQRPGGFLDKRVKIDATKESRAELDRQTRQNTRIGDRQVIIQTVSGFRSNEGAFSTNTLELIRENADRVTDVGLFDRASGVVP